MANKNACINYPEINGKPSKLYKDLLEKYGLSRPMVNYLYVKYTVSNMAQQMESQGYTNKNTQGEHSAEDLIKFIDYASMKNEINDLVRLELQINAIDANDQRIDYHDAREALQIAEDFNNSHSALIAYVREHGDVYNIYLAQKTADNNTIPAGIREKLQLWDLYKQTFGAVGIDIEALPPEVKKTFNAYKPDLVQTLINIKNMSFSNIYKDNARLLLHMDPNSQHVQNLVRQFGSIEAAAEAIDNFNHHVVYPDSQKLLMQRAINHCQKFQNIDLNALKNQAAQMSQQVKTADDILEEDIVKELNKLNKKYGISANEIRKINSKIESLSDAVTEAIFVLQRKMKEIVDKKGSTAEGKKLGSIQDKLLRELNSKKYYAGLITFLQEAASEIGQIDNLIQSTPQTGIEMQKVFANVATLREIKKLKDQYYALISALSSSDIKIDENISSVDIDNLRNTAQTLKDMFDKKQRIIDSLTKSSMVNLLTLIIGDTAPDGMTIDNIVNMAAKDSSLTDFLYSVGRASNPVIAAMGSIIRDAQDARDALMNEYSLRVRRATHALYESGSDTKFMYEDEGHIISDIDWAAYEKARSKEIKRLMKNGLKDWDLKQAIEDWEEQNTEDREVDTKNHRTEKVPDSKYRKAFPQLTQAQKKYYDEMMQLKGEIGTLLPAYAQKQYLPPQLRRQMLDAMAEAKSAKDYVKAVWNKIENIWKVREDDERFNTNGFIDGDEFNITKGNFDNTPLKRIPIFHINRVEQGELLRNFSTGIISLAGTAINYYAMNNIIDVVEFMGDFVTEQSGKGKKTQAEVVGNEFVRIIKDVVKLGKNTNNAALVRGFIDKHIYGENYSPNENPTFVKLWGNLLGYTSFRNLSTNIPGAVSNTIVGEFQMMIEAGAGEFYGIKDYIWAHSKLFGGAGAGGEIMELLTNNVNHKGVLFGEMFDPIQENFSNKRHQKFYKSMFRQLIGHDCSFIGYGSGEYLIHYVNMYAVLHNIKVKLNGKKISLYDAFEVTNKKEGNSELKLKAGVTMEDGSPITDEWLDKVRKKIRYVNQTTHGSMNAEDKGLLHRYWWGRGIANFRQWMVEHYSRRFRKAHPDASLKGEDDTLENREGYWTSYFNAILNEDVKEAWKEGNKGDAIHQFMRDWYTFTFRSMAQWHNLNDMQKYNIKRVQSEMTLYAILCGLSFALGDPDRHKREWWRRWWIYQTKRLILDTQASMPHPKAIKSGLTIFQSPMAGIDTFNSLLYTYYGLANGDLFKEIKSGPHKGENRYWRNIKKNVLPFFKDWEKLQNLDSDDAIFKIFEDSPGRH